MKKWIPFFIVLAVMAPLRGKEIKLPKKLKVSYDKIDHVTSYTSKSTSPNIQGDTWTPIRLEIRQQGREPYLVLHLKYRGKSWIFANRAKLFFGANQMVFSLSNGENRGGDYIEESYSIVLNGEELELFRNYLYSLKRKSPFAISFDGERGYVFLPKGRAMGGLTKKNLRKNASEMTEVMKFYDILLSEVD